MTIQKISANSADGGEVYLLLRLAHSMAGQLANSDKPSFRLARTYSNERSGPIETVWTNGIVDLTARTWRDPEYHEYTLTEARNEQ